MQYLVESKYPTDVDPLLFIQDVSLSQLSEYEAWLAYLNSGDYSSANDYAKTMSITSVNASLMNLIEQRIKATQEYLNTLVSPDHMVYGRDEPEDPFPDTIWVDDSLSDVDPSSGGDSGGGGDSGDGDDNPSGGDDNPSGGDDNPSGGDDNPSGGDDTNSSNLLFSGTITTSEEEYQLLKSFDEYDYIKIDYTVEDEGDYSVVIPCSDFTVNEELIPTNNGTTSGEYTSVDVQYQVSISHTGYYLEITAPRDSSSYIWMTLTNMLYGNEATLDVAIFGIKTT